MVSIFVDHRTQSGAECLEGLWGGNAGGGEPRLLAAHPRVPGHGGEQGVARHLAAVRVPQSWPSRRAIRTPCTSA